MKKFLSVLLAMLLLVVCVGCNNHPAGKQLTTEELEVKQTVVAFYGSLDKKYETFDDLFNELNKYLVPNGQTSQEWELTILSTELIPARFEQMTSLKIGEEKMNSLISRCRNAM